MTTRERQTESVGWPKSRLPYCRHSSRKYINTKLIKSPAMTTLHNAILTIPNAKLTQSQRYPNATICRIRSLRLCCYVKRMRSSLGRKIFEQ